MNILVTGCAGFIGFHTCVRLLNDGHKVFGVDNLNNYYDVKIKLDRLDCLTHENFTFKTHDISSNHQALLDLDFDYIIHLAAQAGVRHSLEHPEDYANTNLLGMVQMLELARKKNCKNFIYASSSSVYGREGLMSTQDEMKPKTLYAATKACNEILAHSYGRLWRIPNTCLRFFTVYGPLGRPDMFMYIASKSIMENKVIKLNGANQKRTFTYIDDIVNGIIKTLHRRDLNAIYNFGGSELVSLQEVIGILEENLEKKAIVEIGSEALGDVTSLSCNWSLSKQVLDWSPNIGIREGLENFIDWFSSYHSYLLLPQGRIQVLRRL